MTDQRPNANVEPTPKPNIIFRNGWHAKKPQYTEPLQHPVTVAVFTYTSTEECSDVDSCTRVLQEIQRTDIREGLPDIRYNFLIGGDGVIYEGRGWHAQPAVNNYYSAFNGKSIHIAYIGDFKHKPLDEDFVRAGLGVLADGYERKYISRFMGLVPINTNQPQRVDLFDHVLEVIKK